MAFSVVFPFLQAVTSRPIQTQLMKLWAKELGMSVVIEFYFGYQWCICFNAKWGEEETRIHKPSAHNFDIDKYRQMAYLFLRIGAFTFFEPLLPSIFWICNYIKYQHNQNYSARYAVHLIIKIETCWWENERPNAKQDSFYIFFCFVLDHAHSPVSVCHSVLL